jgi:hypothetical protein
MRSMLARFFGRGPFLGDCIGTVLNQHSLTITSQTDPGTDPTLAAVMDALMNQGAVGQQNAERQDRAVGNGLPWEQARV